MFIIGYFLQATATVLHFVLYTYMLIVIAHALLSWVSPDPYNPIVRFLYNATEPVLYRIRRALPLTAGSMDFSPMLLILALIFLDQFVVPTLFRIASILGG
ncbi:MAG: YggT family protein [Syntrophobacteraceae bacterium]